MGCHPKPIDKLIFFRRVETTNQYTTYTFGLTQVPIWDRQKSGNKTSRRNPGKNIGLGLLEYIFLCETVNNKYVCIDINIYIYIYMYVYVYMYKLLAVSTISSSVSFLRSGNHFLECLSTDSTIV